MSAHTAFWRVLTGFALLAGWLAAGQLAGWAQGTTTPALTATPSTVSISYQLGATLPAAVSVSVRAASGTPKLTITPPASGAADWMVVSPASATSPATLSVRVNPTGLSAAVYTAVFNVATVDNSNTAVNVTVKLTVTAPPPTLTISPLAVNFVSPSGPTTQSVALTSSGGDVSYTAAVTGATWLTVSPTTGVILPGIMSALTLTVDATGLIGQTAPYTGKITVTANNVASSSKTQTIQVSLTVNTQTPTLTSAWPPSVPVGSPLTVVTLRGTNFVPATVMKISGATGTLKTTYLMATALLAEIPATALATAGTLNLIATNPAPGGDSQPFAFAVSATPTIQVVTDAASYAPANIIAQGELVCLFGQGIGPTTTATMTNLTDSNYADATLGGYTVMVDGQPAPLLLVSPNQITLVVPFSVTVGASKQIVASSAQGAVLTATVTINNTNPAIFTMDGSGAGQAAALNLPSSGVYSLNASATPVKRGDTIVLFTTGLGSDYSTVASQGQQSTPYNVGAPDISGYLNPSLTSPPVPPLELTTMPTVTIGGAAATVSYAGPAGSSIMGLVQINAVVPTGSTTGNSVPVVVNMGGRDSQTGVWLAVK